MIPDKPEKSWTSSKQTVMPGHNVQPGQAFAGQKLKFTGHLSNDRLLFAGLQQDAYVSPNCGEISATSHHSQCDVVKERQIVYLQY